MKHEGSTFFSIGYLSRWDGTEQSTFEGKFGVRGMEARGEDEPGEGGWADGR